MKRTAGFSHAHLLMVLQKIPFFRAFSNDERERLADRQDSFVIARKLEMVVRKGSMEKAFYILLSGTASVVNDEGEVIVTLTPGEVFGEISFLTETPRTSCVRSEEISILMRIDQRLMSCLRAEMREKIKDQLINKLVARILLEANK